MSRRLAVLFSLLAVLASALPALAKRSTPAAPASDAGKMRKLRTVVVGTGALSLDTVKRVGDALEKEPRLDVVDTRTTPEKKPGSPAGGVDGAKQLGASKQADVVVALLPAAGGAIAYEAVDVAHGTVLARGTTPASTDSRRTIADVAQIVIRSLPSTTPVLPSPTVTSGNPTPTMPLAASSPSPTPTPTPMPHPNAPASPAPTTARLPK